MRILAIETSCDETAFAIVDCEGGLGDPRFEIAEDFVSSQIEIHRPWGGVVPNLAKREHLKNLPLLFEKLKTKKESWDVLVVTVGPGLEPALWAGINFAEKKYGELKKLNPKLKLVGVNHLEGHLFSFLLAREKSLEEIFPAVALIASGGHTVLLRIDSLTSWEKLGETRDDAVGESFDKVAKMLDLPYPGGPEIERIAKEGNGEAISFPRPMEHSKDYDFSYSGLKTSVLYFLRDNPGINKKDVAASFQEAALGVLALKTFRAVKEVGAKSVFLSGGVAANGRLRKIFQEKSSLAGAEFLVAPHEFNTDNGVMIAVAAYMSILRNKNLNMEAEGNLDL